MPRIIHIEFKRGRQERFIVHWDNDAVQIFSPETALKYGFELDKEFSEEEWLKILHEDSVRRAKDQALRHLEIRPHSWRELAIKLRKKGYSVEVIEQALQDLQRVDLIDDQKFASLFILNEMRLRPCGRARLREKLRRRGIPPEIFNPLLECFFQKHPEGQIAREIALKFLNKSQSFPTRKKKEKLIRHLQSRGFDWEIIKWILYEEKLIDDEDSGQD